MINDIEKISEVNKTKLKDTRLIYCKRKRSKKLSFNEILLKINNGNKEERSPNEDKHKKNEYEHSNKVADDMVAEIHDSNGQVISGSFFDEFC